MSSSTTTDQDRMAGATLGGAILGGSLAGPGGAFFGGIIGALLADNVNKSQEEKEHESERSP